MKNKQSKELNILYLNELNQLFNKEIKNLNRDENRILLSK
jgi:hypothetical protein